MKPGPINIRFLIYDLIECYLGNEMSKDEMERTCGMSGGEQRYTK
jgi:hypothetical protein